MTAREVTGLLAGGQTTKKYDIPIDHLDYAYIEKCSDVKELEKILKVLRSGEEGIYPEMEKQCAEKIASINPNSRVLRQEQPIASMRDLDREQRMKLTEDLNSWTDEIKSKEETLKSTTRENDIADGNVLPPVRAAGTTATSTKTSKKPKSNKRVKPRDYREWDKVDVDAELQKVDNESPANTLSTNLSHGDPAQVTNEEIKNMSEEERQRRAEREKDKGNEEFKSGDYKQALAYYNRSLAYLPALNSYNNRSLAYVKLKDWDKALADCNTVLQMDSINIKALLRRSIAYKGKSMYTECEADLNKVLELEPQNKRAKDLLDEVIKEKMKTQKEVQSNKAAPSGKGKRMVIEETDGSSSESEEETEPLKSADAAKELKKNSVSEKNQKTADNPPKPVIENNKSTPVDKKIDLTSSLLLNGNSHEDNDINPNITMDINKSKNPKGKVLIEEISTNDSKQSTANNNSSCDSENKSGSGNDLAVCERKTMEVVEPPRQRQELVQKPLPAVVQRLKSSGADLFKAGQYGEALDKYTQAISKLSADQVVNLSLLYSNVAACKSKIGDCKGCIEASTKSLELVPHAVKPLLRRADAYEHTEKYDMAYVDYRHILNMDSTVENALRGSTRCSNELRKVKGVQWRDNLPSIPRPSIEDIPLVTMLGAGSTSPSQSGPVQSSPPPPSAEPTKSKDELFEENKSQGNEFVKKGNFKEAVTKYNECIKLCPEIAAPYTNRALCNLRLNKPSLAKDDCSEALKLEPNNVKALFRRGQAYKMLGQYQDSFNDLKTLLKIEPKNGPAKKEMQLVLKYISEENQKAKAQAKQSKNATNAKRRVNIQEVGSSDDDD